MIILLLLLVVSYFNFNCFLYSLGVGTDYFSESFWLIFLLRKLLEENNVNKVKVNLFNLENYTIFGFYDKKQLTFIVHCISDVFSLYLQ